MCLRAQDRKKVKELHQKEVHLTVESRISPAQRAGCRSWRNWGLAVRTMTKIQRFLTSIGNVEKVGGGPRFLRNDGGGPATTGRCGIRGLSKAEDPRYIRRNVGFELAPPNLRVGGIFESRDPLHYRIFTLEDAVLLIESSFHCLLFWSFHFCCSRPGLREKSNC